MPSPVVREDTKPLLTPSCSVSSRLSSAVRGGTASPLPPQDAASAVSPPTCDCQPQTGTYCPVGVRLVDMAATAQTEAAETGNLIPLNITVSALIIHWGYTRNETLLALLNKPWGLRPLTDEHEFFEEDEPIEKIKAAWARGEKGFTDPPPSEIAGLRWFSLLVSRRRQHVQRLKFWTVHR